MGRGWIWFAVGVGGALLFWRRRTSTPNARDDGWQALGMPTESQGALVTPHGSFGASRVGPPAHAHQGLDLAAPANSFVRAVGDGRIVATRPGLGKIVRKLRLEPPGAWTDRGAFVTHVVYADLGDALVQAGDRVRKGDAIARVAREGFVHFAIKRLGAHGEEFFDPAEAGFPYRTSMKGVA
jgi:murein DD-endopeptidase MepM/ murein hydrolase activator NlpD